jgi:hypothetical protein
MTQEEMNRLVATQIREIKDANPDQKDVLLVLHDDSGTEAYAAGDDVDKLTKELLNLSSSFAIIDIYGRR